VFFFDSGRNFSFRIGRNQHYDLTRTLAVKVISHVVSKSYGQKIHVFNANYQFTEFAAFTYVVRELGELDRIMMCEIGHPKKWCGRCTKCAQLVLYCLALGIDQSEIGVDDFLINSPWTAKALANATGPESPWYKGLSYPGHIDSLRMVLGMIGRRSDLLLSGAAKANLDKIVGAYSSNKITMEDGIFAKNLFAQWPSEYAPKVYDILCKVLPVYDSPAFSKMWGNVPVYRAEEKQAVDRSLQLIAALLDRFHYLEDRH
jgi:hypothetical protein